MDGTRLEVTFKVRVEALELDRYRMHCQLLQVQAVSGNRPESQVDPFCFERVMNLIGKRAMIPLEALGGIVLPLRLATLTGEHPYFFD